MHKFAGLLSSSALVFFAQAQIASAAPQGTGGGNIISALATCIAESAANGFKMPDTSDPNVSVVEANSDGIEQQMPYAPRDPRIPESIQGLWWMDGNPLGLLTTFSNATWDPATRTATLTMYEPGNFSFYALPWEDCQFKGVLKGKVRFEVKFNATYDFATLINEATGPDGKTIKNNDLIYTMQFVSDGHWVRRSWINGIRADYQLRRIVDKNGKRDPAYDDYLKIATATSALAKPAPQ